MLGLNSAVGNVECELSSRARSASLRERPSASCSPAVVSCEKAAVGRSLKFALSLSAFQINKKLGEMSRYPGYRRVRSFLAESGRTVGEAVT